MEREGEISIGDPPATFKSFVWQHFGFPVEIRNGERVTDKTNTICKHCKKTMPYTAANTSTMQKHIQNHHISLLKPAAHVTKTLKGQTTLNAVASLPPSSARATAITRENRSNILCYLHLPKHIFPSYLCSKWACFFNCRRHSYCPMVSAAARNRQHANILEKEHDHILGCSV